MLEQTADYEMMQQQHSEVEVEEVESCGERRQQHKPLKHRAH